MVPEPVELALELLDGGRTRLARQPLLLGLVEPLDLAAGLRVVHRGVAEGDAERRELELDRAPASASGARR